MMLVFNFTIIFPQEKEKVSVDPFLLVLSSYNPDNYRFAQFTRELEKYFDDKGHNERILIEDMGYNGISNISTWKEKMKDILLKYDDENLKAILILGQEAWCSFINQDTLVRNVPFFVSFASDNVLKLPDNNETNEFSILSVTKDYENHQFRGGFLNEYDVEGNIKLIQHLYPDTKEIAFLSDNSYGGIAIQSLLKKEMKEKFPHLNLLFLDCRFESINTIKERITNLSSNTALLIGTWRINKNGLYLSKNIIRDIIPANLNIPVFSLTGTGINDVAIGGYIPAYGYNVESIADNIMNCFDSTEVIRDIQLTKSEYHFNKDKLKKFGISDYMLPSDRVINDPLESKIKEYQDYITIILIVLFLICILFAKYIITDKKLKLKHEELLIALEKAEQSEKLKTAFLANMSHEIRTPLNAIVGFSDMLIDSEEHEERKQFGDIINTNNNLLLNIINDLLDLSKIEAGSLDFHMEQIPLNNLFQNEYSSFKFRVDPNVEFILDIPQKNIYIWMDPKRLSQILSNYLSNAIKFTKSGKITLGYHDMNNGVYMYVEDTGIGIAEEHHPKVFNRFEKVDTFAQGSGLGLSICMALEEAVGGKTGFESEINKGSKFWCWLPYNVSTDKKDFSPATVKLQKKNLDITAV